MTPIHHLNIANSNSSISGTVANANSGGPSADPFNEPEVFLSKGSIRNYAIPVLKESVSELRTEKSALEKRIKILGTHVSAAEKELQAIMEKVTQLKSSLQNSESSYQKTMEILGNKESELRSLHEIILEPMDFIPEKGTKRPLSPISDEQIDIADSSEASDNKKLRVTESSSNPSIMSKIFKSGTEIYYECKKGKIDSYDSEAELFTISIEKDNTSIQANKKQLRFLPQEGEIYLIKAPHKDDSAQRYFDAKIMKIIDSPADPTSGGKLKVRIKWIYNNTVAERQFRQLDSILPISSKDPLTNQFDCYEITDQNKAFKITPNK